MMRKETREYLTGILRTLTPKELVSLREDLLALIREAEGFLPVMRYDDQTSELAGALASLTAEQLQSVVQTAKAMRKNADRQARQIWRQAVCTNER